ncbi:hypothetical protein [Corynebacterium lactis]|uniref:Secreted protein n=1 Tax=Corynebacterium lactis RW2-5 TaxID=1408189 RepID=A0A0K2H367_9CORY|nr:hypothetical protein [Corynebacterium lactis]ALA68479.1 hypothetical protein CLAC_04110 [Corynebacterium lactis RW2-5]
MRNRIAGAIAASAIAAAALVACSPPNEQDSDVKVGDQKNPAATFEQKKGGAESATPEQEMAPGQEMQNQAPAQ